MTLLQRFRALLREPDESKLPLADLPTPGVGEQEPDDPATIPPDEGDALSGARP